MNLLNVAAGTIASPMRPQVSLPIASLMSAQTGGGADASAIPARDNASSELSGDLGLVSLLQQFASSHSGDAGTSAIDFSLGEAALPPMPAPKPAPTVPTVGHGQSNIVFSTAGSDSDPDADAALIR